MKGEKGVVVTDGRIVVEAYLDQFGRVTRREFWWLPARGRPERISPRKYAALLRRGYHWEVNAYAPTASDEA